jgi:hypothetical protein
VEIQALEAQSPDDLGRAFALMIRAEVGAVQIMGDAMFSVYGKQIADLRSLSTGMRQSGLEFSE